MEYSQCRSDFNWYLFQTLLTKKNDLINRNTYTHLILPDHIEAEGNKRSQLRLTDHYSRWGDHLGSVRFCLIQIHIMIYSITPN